jgi:hypothetical protein
MVLRKVCISVLAMLFALVSSSTAKAERKVVKAQVAPGGEVLCDYKMHWDQNCEPRPAPTIKITRPPANGTAEVRPGTFVVKNPWHPNANRACIGKSFPGLGIYYRANQTFRGVDTFGCEYKIGPQNNIVTFEVEVEVTVQ